MENLRLHREIEVLRIQIENKAHEVESLTTAILSNEKLHLQNIDDMRSKYEQMRQSVLQGEIQSILIHHKTEIIQLESLTKQFQNKALDLEN